MSRLDLFVPAKAASHRQKKVSEEIKHHLAMALARGDLPPVRNPKNNGFLSFSNPITVTKVDASPDLKHVTVYVMPLGGFDQAQALQFIRLQRGHLRKLLGTKIQLRHTPDLHFQLDNSIDEAERIHKMIAQVVKSDETKDVKIAPEFAATEHVKTESEEDNRA